MGAADAGFSGATPGLAIGAGNPEAAKYGRLWTMPEYRRIAPGELLADVFLRQARPRPGATVVDFGCGTGRGALMLALLGRLRVVMVDFVANCLDDEVRLCLASQAQALSFVKADLERGPLPVSEYGYCTDVMEHIPSERVDLVLNNILCATRHVFFSIATTPDSCGALIGEPLHLTVRPYAWWLAQLRDRGAIVHWAREADGTALFYATAWTKGRDFIAEGFPINVEEAAVRDNVRRNVAGGWQQVVPHEENDVEVMILGGGPSLLAYEDEIRTQRAAGVKLVTLNGAYNWALARGLAPSAQVIVDARPFNARFVRPVVDGCKYLLASQVDPSVLEGLPRDRTYLWHSDTELVKDLLDAAYELWFTVPGGSTVLTRAITLLRMLGFRRFHLYGCDSCLAAGAHHAYSQPENDGAPAFPVVVTAEGPERVQGAASGRVFYCNGWMLSQAQEMIELVRFMGDVIELEVHGDGLLAQIFKTGADVADAVAAGKED